MMGFFDDNTGFVNHFDPQADTSLEDLTRKMKDDAQLWTDLLWCSGGKLELPKCSFFALRFLFPPEGSAKPVREAPPTTMTVTDREDDSEVEIPTIRSDETHKLLGHYLSPVPSPRGKLHPDESPKQLDALLEKAVKTVSLISASPLTRYGTTLVYHGVYLAQLGYVLPQCSFSAKELNRTEAKTISNVISKMGYNCHTARALRYAPTSYAGCGLVSWYTLQGVGQIMLFLKHWRTDTMVSRILRCALSWCQWQSGLSKSLLRDTKTRIPHVAARWIPSLRTFLRKIDGMIELTNDYTVPPEREGDIHIMDYAIRSGVFHDDELKLLNYCRQYLVITTVSEMFDEKGERLLPHVWKCQRPPWFNKKKYIILQQRPSDYQIKYRWKRFCRELVSEAGRKADDIQFGAWTRQGACYRPRRQSYHSNGKFYLWDQDSYHRLVHTGTRCIYRLTRSTTWLPTGDEIPVQFERFDDNTTSAVFPTFRLVSDTPYRPPPRRDNQLDLRYATFADYVSTLAVWEQQLLTPIKFATDAYSIMHDLHERCSMNGGTDVYLLDVSDGSMAHGTTTYGWIIGDSKGTRMAWCAGPGYGTATSHRAEAWGRLSAALFLSHLPLFCQRAYPSRLHISSRADNQGMITSLINRNGYKIVYPNATLTSDWDVLEQIHTTLKKANLPRHDIEWLKGHQDSAKSFEELPVAAQYNVLADELAEDAMLDDSSERHRSPLLPAARCQLVIRGRTVHGNYVKTIREAAALPDYFSYLQDKHKWCRATRQSINWSWLKRAADNYSHTDNHLMKLVHDKLPTRYHHVVAGGKKEWLPVTCRHCGSQPETFEHLLLCDHPTGDAFRKRLLTNIEKYCQDRKVPPLFRRRLIDSLSIYLGTEDSWMIDIDTPTLAESSQAKIGWYRMLKGFLSQEWEHYLDYTFRVRSRHIPAPAFFDHTQFFSGLIKLMWSAQTQFWSDYQALIHNTSEKNSTSAAKLDETKAEIRHLYSLRAQVCHEHRDLYFERSLQHHLQQSSPYQLQIYLQNYRPRIRASIVAEKARRKTSERSITSFDGFSVKHRTTTPRTTPSNVSEPLPHKHSRWKLKSYVQNKLTSFFASPDQRSPSDQSTNDSPVLRDDSRAS